MTHFTSNYCKNVHFATAITTGSANLAHLRHKMTNDAEQAYTQYKKSLLNV